MDPAPLLTDRAAYISYLEARAHCGVPAGSGAGAAQGEMGEVQNAA